MLNLHFNDHHQDFPPLLSAVSLVLALAVIGGVLFEAATTAAAIVA